jgi:tight adherence protein B
VDVLAATCGALAILALGLGLQKRPPEARSLRGWLRRQRERREAEVRAARIHANPDTYLALTLAAPVVLAAVGSVQSIVFAVIGAVAGLLLPRFYVRFLIRSHAHRSEAEAPKLLQVLLANLTAGSTYLDALRQARISAQDEWIQEDLDYVIQRFLLDVPLETSIREIRARVHSRNLGLIWDNLAICCANRVPTQTARALFTELASTIQFNVQLANEVRARASGQRIQIWLLALIVPGMYLYLRLLNPEFLSPLNDTSLGRYVLVPVAALLEVLGLYLSYRLSRFEA